MQTVHIIKNSKKYCKSLLTMVSLQKEKKLNPICCWPKVRKMRGLQKNKDCVVEPVHFLIDCISPQQFVAVILLSRGIDLKQGKGGICIFTPLWGERNDYPKDNDKELGTISQKTNVYFRAFAKSGWGGLPESFGPLFTMYLSLKLLILLKSRNICMFFGHFHHHYHQNHHDHHRGERIVFWRPNTNTNNIRQQFFSEYEYE